MASLATFAASYAKFNDDFHSRRKDTRTRFRCTSSNLFSAAVFLSLLPATGTAELLPDADGDPLLRPSSSSNFSSSFTISGSGALSFSFSSFLGLDLDFFLRLFSYHCK